VYDDCFRIPVLSLASIRWVVYDALDVSASDASHFYLEPPTDHGAPDLEVGQPALIALGGYHEGVVGVRVGCFEADGCDRGFWFQRALPLIVNFRVI